MNAIKLLPNYTYEDYCQWEGRWELIEGIPFAMSPSPSVRHQLIVANIIRVFGNALEKSHCKNCRVIDFIDIKIANHTVVQPDCSIICGKFEGSFLEYPPALVVEVLSQATTLKDRHTKHSLYEKFGIGYYFIVDPEKEVTEIYHLENHTYVLQPFALPGSFQLSLGSGCSIQILPDNFWG